LINFNVLYVRNIGIRNYFINEKITRKIGEKHEKI